MALRIDDRWLWLGFGVFFFLATKGLRYAIQDTIELTRVHPSRYEPEHKRSGEQPEDIIAIEALRTLAKSPNLNIANAAISIIVSRFQKLPNRDELLKQDLNSPDENVRERAKTAVRFLKEKGVRVKMLPRSPPTMPESPRASFDSPSPETFLAASDLADMLGNGIGGVNGGDAWVGQFVPTAANPVAGWTDVPRERPVAGDDEELERRRRRREAMVLHEGAGAVREDDIIRPRQ